MRARDIFDLCLLRVRECQAMEARVTAIRPDACAKDGPPQVGNAPAEYVADFQICGRRAIDGRKWDVSRTKKYTLFQLYFVADGKAKQVQQELQISERTLYRWASEVKRVVGPELARAGLWPPRVYRQKTNAKEMN